MKVYLAPALGLRAAIGKSLGIELVGTLPLLATIRNDGAVGLRLAYRISRQDASRTTREGGGGRPPREG